MARLEVKFAAEDVDEKTGAFSGYGSAFDNVDSYGDVMAKGAFKATLRDWAKEKKLPPMLLQHGGWMMTDTDALPVGKWTKMEEDEVGLRVEGRLINLDTDLGKRVYGAMKEGVLDGMSIGYRAKKFTMGTKPEEPRRTLEAVELVEVSLVTFPANGKARVAQVKSAQDIMTIRDLEDILRDAGCSRSEALAICSRFEAKADQRDAGADVAIAAGLDRLLSRIRA